MLTTLPTFTTTSLTAIHDVKMTITTSEKRSFRGHWFAFIFIKQRKYYSSLRLYSSDGTAEDCHSAAAECNTEKEGGGETGFMYVQS